MPNTTINLDRLNKLGATLVKLDNEIRERQAKRDAIANELRTVLDVGTSVSSSKAATDTPTKSTGKNKKGSLGDRIVTFIQSNPGAVLSQIAKSLKVAPNQAALSLYHLAKKGSVYTEDNKYYNSLSLQAMAKSGLDEQSGEEEF